MIKTLTHQTIALAGLLQAVHAVQCIAKTGTANAEDMEISILSTLKIDAEDVPDVYGGIDKLKTGLKLLENQLGGPETIDSELARYAASLIFLQFKLKDLPKMQAKIKEGVQKAEFQTSHFGPMHENVLAKLADTYQETISQLKPRVMIMGEPMHLTNPNNVNKIRALLLAGIRSAVLWQQCGGSRWKFLLNRRKMQTETHKLLESIA